MAILSKIREKTVVLIGVIGLALFAFVVQDAFTSQGSNNGDVIGMVDGEEVKRTEFNQQMESFRARAGRNVSDIQTSNNVWEGILRDLVYKKQIEEAGVVVGENDVWQSILNLPYFQNDPSFKNEGGLLDEEKVKAFIANLRDEALNSDKDSQERLVWQNWLSTEAAIRDGAASTTYTTMANAGLSATLEEGKNDFLFKNTMINADFVYVPFASISDSLVSITDQDYKDYIKAHARAFEVEESRSIKYVNFVITPSAEDRLATKMEVASVIDELKSAKNSKDFINEVQTDIPVSDAYIFKSKLSRVLTTQIDTANIGDVVGPYEENGYYKISKVEAFKKMPDSVSASHILITFIGSRAASPETVQTKDQAKATADSLLAVIKADKSKFSDLAKELSADKSNAEKGGDLSWFTYDRMVPEFRDYAFENKKGDIGIAETAFGYHIIKIDDQKNFQNTIKLATLSRQILPSETTNTKYYQDAEILASKISKGGDFDELVAASNYGALPANNIKVLDENIPGLQGGQRQIVRWTFNEDTSIDDVKRFDTDNGYVVAVLTSKTAKGLAPVSDVASRIKTKVLNEKKAAIISAKMDGSSLEDIALANKINKMNANNVSLASPTLSGVGTEPAVVGAMSTAPEGKLISNIVGDKGMFAIKVNKRTLPSELESYATYSSKLETQLKASAPNQLYQALKANADIEDYRASIY